MATLQVFDPDGDVVLTLANDAHDENLPTRMRVSSKHLSLASPVFKAMFSTSFREGASLKSAGSVEISLPEDDVLALSILLRLIHGQATDVPRQVDLILLTKIAVLVDKYQLHKVTVIASDIWITNLGSIPESFGEDMYRWLCISWVFKQRGLFDTATLQAQLGSTNPLESDPPLALPIPDAIISRNPPLHICCYNWLTCF